MSGLLIVNADDLGFSRRGTQATLACFDAEAISSATAMVWMRDSDHATAAARERGLPVGLHLNLTVEFTASSVPREVRDRQREAVAWLARDREGQDSRASEPPSRLLQDTIRDQIDRLRELYGEPTHLDGHHHVHLHPRVLSEIPDGLPVRPPLSRPDGRGHPLRLPRGRRGRSPRWTFAFEHVHPELGGVGPSAIARGRRETIEVMTHPAQDQQLRALMGDAWRGMLVGYDLGSYATLTARSRGDGGD